MKRLAALLGLLPALASAQFGPEEKRAIDAFYVLSGRSVRDLESPAITAPLTPAGIAQAPTRPFETAETMRRLHEMAKTEPAWKLLRAIRTEMFSEGAEAPVLTSVSLPTQVPVELRAPVGRMIQTLAWANGEIRAALAPLSREERRALIDGLPGLVSSQRASFSFAKGTPRPAKELLSLVAKVDLARIRAAGVVVVEAAQQAAREIKANRGSLKQDVEFSTSGVKVVLSVGGKTFAAKDAMLCVILGGQNRVTGRYGAGIGYASALIDFGETEYDVDDASAGAGLLGVGVAYLGPHSGHLIGHSLCFGSGLAGVGALLKEGGANTFESGALSQGFGAFGFGLFVANGAKLDAIAGDFSQGSARGGGVGWFISRAKICALSATSGHRRAYAQGASIGFPGVPSGPTGGAGLCTLVGESASLEANGGAQGIGADGGLGSLAVDAGRSSLLRCPREGDGFAEDFGQASLFLSGEGARVEAGRAIGEARYGGFAFVEGRARNAIYSSEFLGGISRAGLALWIQTAPGAEYRIAKKLEQGEERWLLDLASLSLPEVSLGPTASGIALGAADATPTLEPGKASALDVVEGDRPASLAPESLLDPAALKGASLAWIRFAAAIAASQPEVAMRILRPSLESPDEDLSAGALAVAAEANLPVSEASVAAGLKKAKTAPFALRLAGRLGLKGEIGDILPLAAGSDETGIAAIRALADLGDPSALATGVALLGSPLDRVRTAAIDLVSKFPDSALSEGTRLIEQPDLVARRAGIRLLGKLGSAKALEAIGTRLKDPQPGVRIEAIRELSGRCPESAREAFLSLQSDPDPLVRLVSAGASIGL